MSHRFTMTSEEEERMEWLATWEDVSVRDLFARILALYERTAKFAAELEDEYKQDEEH